METDGPDNSYGVSGTSNEHTEETVDPHGIECLPHSANGSIRGTPVGTCVVTKCGGKTVTVWNRYKLAHYVTESPGPEVAHSTFETDEVPGTHGGTVIVSTVDMSKMYLDM